MSLGIELLWLIPVFAAALFLPIIILASRTKPGEGTGQDLYHQVDSYNQREVSLQPIPPRAEKRLNDIEETISKVSATLSSQQKIIDDFRGRDAGHVDEFAELKEKLRELQREYDIVISENYSLRARLKRFMESQGIAAAVPHQGTPGDEIRGPKDQHKPRAVNMQLYDDTRMFHAADFNDTAEINLSELK